MVFTCSYSASILLLLSSVRIPVLPQLGLAVGTEDTNIIGVPFSPS